MELIQKEVSARNKRHLYPPPKKKRLNYPTGRP